MKVVVCDDELQEGKQTSSIMEGMGIADVVIEYMTPSQLKSYVEDGKNDIQIVVMDIEFKGMDYNGIVLGELINNLIPQCQIIYLSAILEFAPEVYETKHCYFVLKNNKELMLPRAVNKAVANFSVNMDKDVIEILCEGRKVLILQKDILYIERQGRMLKVYLADREMCFYDSLRNVIKKLNNNFARSHGGFLVNLNYVKSLGNNELFIEGGISIPVGKTFAEELKKKYLEFLSVKI